jgi:hypothetical protein
VRRAETFIALAAVVLASLSVLHVRGHLWFAVAAVALLIAVIASRVRRSLAQRGGVPAKRLSAYDRAMRISESRRNRLDRF